MIHKEYSNIVNEIRQRGLYPKIHVINGISSRPIIQIGEKSYINFASANYLGLAEDERIIKEVTEGMKKYGLHPTSSRLTTGTLDVHVKLEDRISMMKNTESSMLFTTGTMANIGTIAAVLRPPLTNLGAYIREIVGGNRSTVFSDQLNHATIIDGCRLSKANIKIYKHKDVDDLTKKLRFTRGRKLIVSDGVFSMDGDIAPLPELIRVAKDYDAMLMIDDAHASGVLGENGNGTMEYFNLKNGVDINMGTFSKAYGLLGGFIAGEKDLIDYLRISARTYIFSGAFFGSVAMGILKAIEIVKNEKYRRQQLWKITDRFRDGLKQIGFNTLSSQTPIIPILIGDENIAINFSESLFERGILAPSMRWPAVEKGKARIRFSITYNHTEEQINMALRVLEELKNKYKL